MWESSSHSMWDTENYTTVEITKFEDGTVLLSVLDAHGHDICFELDVVTLIRILRSSGKQDP
jgi:hypothetical protein